MEKKLFLAAGYGSAKLPKQEVNFKGRFYKRALLVLTGVTILGLCVSKYAEPVLKALYGIRTPCVENKASLLNVAEKYHLDIASIVTVAPSEFQNVFKLFGKSIPEAIIFDRNGNHIEYKATSRSCNAGLFSFIRGLDKNGVYRKDQNVDLSAVLVDLRDINGNRLAPAYLDSTANFYILISWTSFTGRLNKDHVQKWQSLAADNKNAKIQVIEVNFDAQECWPQTAKDNVLKMFGMK